MRHKVIKELTKAVFRSFGLDLRPARNIPFGVEWYHDIQYFTKASKLEIILDVGANIGQTALSLSKHFSDSLIYCFEPVPSTFEELVTSTKALPKVKAINQALGEKINRVPMTAKPLAEQNTLVINGNKSTSGDCETVLVDVNTLDNFCQSNKIDKINLLKIDTEGYEMNVLKGAQQLLSAHKIDYIVVECDFFRRSNEPHGDFFEVFNYLKSWEYNVVSFYTGGIDACGWKWGDVLFKKSTGEEPKGYARSPFQK